MSVTREDVVAFLSRLSPGELRDLLLELEDLWGTAPVYTEYSEPKHWVFMGAPPDRPKGQTDRVEVPEFEVVLLWAGPRRVHVMKALREAIATLTLAEVMVLVEQTPSVVKRGVHREVHELRMTLEALGAKVEIR